MTNESVLTYRGVDIKPFANLFPTTRYFASPGGPYYIWSDGSRRQWCTEGDDEGGWFDSPEDACRAVDLYRDAEDTQRDGR